MENQLTDTTADYGGLLEYANTKVMPQTGTKSQIVHTFQDGRTSVVSLSNDSYFDVEIQFDYISDTVKTYILDLYHTTAKANGGENTFYWKHPRTEIVYVARFMSPLRTVFKPGDLQSISTIKLRLEGYLSVGLETLYDADSERLYDSDDNELYATST